MIFKVGAILKDVTDPNKIAIVSMADEGAAMVITTEVIRPGLPPLNSYKKQIELFTKFKEVGTLTFPEAYHLAFWGITVHSHWDGRFWQIVNDPDKGTWMRRSRKEDKVKWEPWESWVYERFFGGTPDFKWKIAVEYGVLVQRP